MKNEQQEQQGEGERRNKWVWNALPEPLIKAWMLLQVGADLLQLPEGSGAGMFVREHRVIIPEVQALGGNSN